MEEFICKLNQRVSINYLDIPLFVEKNSPISDESQLQILSTLDSIAQYNSYYSKSVVKKIIELLESNGDNEINELYYEKLMEWLSSRPLKPTDTDVIKYTIAPNKFIYIKESPNLISGLGTTGLRTWEASLFLTDYIINKMPKDMFNRDFKDRVVLELGCGTGFVGISLLRHLKDDLKKVVLTDGDSQLIDKIGSNFIMNDIDVEDPKLEVCKLWWGEDGLPDHYTVDTLVAADVTYDKSIIPSLIAVINESMSQGRVKTVYVAATLRNKETLEVWEQYLNMGVSDDIWDWQVIQKRNSNTLVDTKNDGTIWYPEPSSEIRVYMLQNTRALE